jgi:ABC-type bacteriocin/lantibiotic exporter with double-glycine peptidase domain
MLQNVVTIGVGIFIGFIYSWQLTLLIIAFLPLIVFGAVIQIRLIEKFAKKNNNRLEDAGKVFI